MTKSQELYKKAKSIIPGGTQLLSKRPEMFGVDNWPSYYSKAKGCEVWDLDNNKYKDFSYMGIGSNVLGYADDDINEAVKQSIDKSNMCTLNAPEEVELAEELCTIHPWADMVRYAKSGGESATISIRIARAKTKKDIVLFCGYHGWHDWYLASNLGDENNLEGHLLPGLSPAGVPKGLKGSSFPFSYNNKQEFDNLINKYDGKIAAVIMEPLRNIYPEDGFLEYIRAKTQEKNIVLIFDEISAGFRLCLGGSHLTLGIEPDIALFGKALSNGFPMAAIIGRKEVMQTAQDTFISSTYWTDRIGLVASLETIKKFKENSVEKVLEKNGSTIQEGWKNLAAKHKLNISIMGIKPLSYFSFNYSNDKEIKTLFIQEMLKLGFMSTTGYYASFAHSESDIKEYLDATDKVFEKLAAAIEAKNVNNLIHTELCHSGFKRLT
ncbi:aminotransferase class III-fold pyridoxal phosphate-dependent enzyme [Halarcobacter sp.]|uniref:aminotransferase class III-fold pyridoxal phosphate-dependent enzyme n=1 Tax=Halarcobacter sp. TaxID=2321133 RepID=UPI003A8D9EF2